MKSDVWYDEELGIVRMQLVGKIYNEEYLQVNRKMIETIPPEKRTRQLIDLTESESIPINKETRKQIPDEARASEVPGTRSAIVGASPIARMLSKMMLTMRKEENIQKTEKEAISWLKEK